MKRSCSSMAEVADVFNHNMDTFTNEIRRINKRLTKLEKKNCSFVMAGLIFGVATELCFMAQNQKIAALEEKIGELNTEMKELRDKEGD